MRVRAAAVRAVVETECLREPQGMDVHLPSRGAVRAWLGFEDVDETLARVLHLFRGPPRIRSEHAVLPLDVVPAMDAHLESGIANVSHHVGASASDVRARKQGS